VAVHYQFETSSQGCHQHLMREERLYAVSVILFTVDKVVLDGGSNLERYRGLGKESSSKFFLVRLHESHRVASLLLRLSVLSTKQEERSNV
jgi:hypothetical protein